MLIRLRSRLLAGNIVTITLVIVLLVLFLIERLDYQSYTSRQIELDRAARVARELSLYVQYNIHDTNAYLLGHLEYKQSYKDHAVAFDKLIAELQNDIDTGVLENSERAVLDQIRRLRADFDKASLQMFNIADVRRVASSPQSQIIEEEAWRRSEQLGNEVDKASRALAVVITDQVRENQETLETRSKQVIALVVGIGVVIVGLMLLVQVITTRAVGAPLQALLDGIQRFTAGNLDTRVATNRRDEVGTLARAFNEMAATVQQQRQSLVRMDEVEKARAEAEEARSHIAEQLATIEQQNTVIREMSVPVLPLNERTLVMPLVGALDSIRIQMVREQALQRLVHSGARQLILDITGVPVVDTQVAQGLIQTIHAARLVGAEIILVGIRPEIAQTIVGLGIRLDEVATYSTLQSGVAHAFERNRRDLVKR